MSSGPSFRSDFVFNINLLILLGFLLTSFHLTEASLFSFSWFSTLVYAVIQKYHEMSFIYSYTHFSTHFAINLFYLQQLENVNKPWNNNRTEHVIKRNKKNKTKSRHIQIDHAFYCSIQPTNNVMASLNDGFIMISEVKGRFLVNNRLMFGTA